MMTDAGTLIEELNIEDEATQTCATPVHSVVHLRVSDHSQLWPESDSTFNLPSPSDLEIYSQVTALGIGAISSASVLAGGIPLLGPALSSGLFHSLAYSILRFIEAPEHVRFKPLKLEDQFELRDAPRVNEFLRTRPDLFGLISELRSKLDEYFDNIEYRLEVVDYPEESGDGQLVVSPIILDDSFDDQEVLERFREEWWLDNMKRFRGDAFVFPRYE